MRSIIALQPTTSASCRLCGMWRLSIPHPGRKFRFRTAEVGFEGIGIKTGHPTYGKVRKLSTWVLWIGRDWWDSFWIFKKIVESSPTECPSIFYNIIEYLKMFENVLGCFRFFVSVPLRKRSRLFQNFPKCFKIFEEFRECARIFQNFQKCLILFHNVIVSSRRFRNVGMF